MVIPVPSGDHESSVCPCSFIRTLGKVGLPELRVLGGFLVEAQCTEKGIWDLPWWNFWW